VNFFVESVRIIDLFFRQLSSVFYSGGTRSSIIFCLFDRFFFAFIHGTSLQSARHQIELTHFLVFSYATNYNKTLFSFDGGDLWRSEKTTTTYRHIPQYPELSCYAKKKNKKNTFVWGCLWLCCCFLIRLCVLTLQKDQCMHTLTGGMMSHPPTAIWERYTSEQQESNNMGVVGYMRLCVLLKVISSGLGDFK
jgi:hypothetical protein